MHKYETELVKHHFMIGVIVFIIWNETLVICCKLWAENYRGQHLYFMDHIHVQIEVMRQTLARLLLILVSLGWGVILPTNQITDKMKKALKELGVMYYFGASISSHVIVECIRTNDFDNAIIIFPLIIMQCFLDSFIFWVVYVNLSDILDELKESKQMEKYKHYLYFSRALCALCIFAILDVIFESAIRNDLCEYFEFTQLRVCFSHFACLLMTIVVMILWRPTRSSAIYAFVEQIPNTDYGDLDLEDDEQSMSMAQDDEIEEELGGVKGSDVMKTEWMDEVDAMQRKKDVNERFEIGEDEAAGYMINEEMSDCPVSDVDCDEIMDEVINIDQEL